MENNKNLIRQYLSRSVGNLTINDDDDLFRLGLVHSMFSIQLVMFIEKTFHIQLEDADLDIENIKTIERICNLIKSKSMTTSTT